LAFFYEFERGDVKIENFGVKVSILMKGLLKGLIQKDVSRRIKWP
jgi:hypothetical protein